MSADPAFRGDPALVNPEQPLLAAAISCQLLSFLAIAARSGVDVLPYGDDAEAVMPEDDRPVRITEIVLRPRVVVRGAADDGRLRAKVGRLLAKAHDECYVANSLTATMRIEPAVEIAP